MGIEVKHLTGVEETIDDSKSCHRWQESLPDLSRVCQRRFSLGQLRIYCPKRSPTARSAFRIPASVAADRASRCNRRSENFNPSAEALNR
jgi:hypothetical protein